MRRREPDGSFNSNSEVGIRERARLTGHFPALEMSAELSRLLGAPWTKNVEDQTDAFFCALIGHWHWLHRGRRTQLLSDATTGFILVPRP